MLREFAIFFELGEVSHNNCNFNYSILLILREVHTQNNEKMWHSLVKKLRRALQKKNILREWVLENLFIVINKHYKHQHSENRQALRQFWRRISYIKKLPTKLCPPLYWCCWRLNKHWTDFQLEFLKTYVRVK